MAAWTVARRMATTNNQAQQQQKSCFPAFIAKTMKTKTVAASITSKLANN